MLAFMLFLIAACTELLEDGGPLGPTAFPFRITSTEAKVAKGDTHTFSAINGVTPIFWSIENTPIGNIDAGTGVFTAVQVAGSATVTATDSNGLRATATITVLPNQLVVTPGNVSLAVAGAQDFTTAGPEPFLWKVNKDTANSAATVVLGATTTNTVTATLTIATTATDTWTISVTDSTGDVGAATLIMDTR